MSQQSENAQPLKVDVSESSGAMTINLAGRLDAAALPDAWTRTVVPAAKSHPARILLEVKNLDFFDGSGLGLFAELRRIAATSGGTLEFSGLDKDQKRLVDMSLLKDPAAPMLENKKPASLPAFVGLMAWTILKDQYQLIAYVGELSLAFLWALTHPHRLRKREILIIAEKAGVNALPVISLLGLLVGMILAYQMADPLRRYAAESLIPTIVSFALIRELGPLITAIIIAGRSGSAFAAEIGTMKVTEELAALKTLGLEPVRFLAVPRVLAALLVTPLLTLYNLLLGLVGACLVMVSMGYSVTYFVKTVNESIKLHDFLGGIFKSLVFALIIAGVGCLRGQQTKSGPGAVGDSTTRAVVAGIVLTIVADAIIGVIYYYLGI